MYKSSLESLLFIEREITKLLISIRRAIKELTPSYQWVWLQEQDKDFEQYNRLDEELANLLEANIATPEANHVLLNQVIAATLRQKQQLDEKYSQGEVD